VDKEQEREDISHAKYLKMSTEQKRKDREPEGDELDQLYTERRVSSIKLLTLTGTFT
jgi:hypothetical protein